MSSGWSSEENVEGVRQRRIKNSSKHIALGEPFI